MTTSKVIGVLTAGGDCPGLNAVIRGVVARATEVHDAEVVGIENTHVVTADGLHQLGKFNEEVNIV